MVNNSKDVLTSIDKLSNVIPKENKDDLDLLISEIYLLSVESGWFEIKVNRLTKTIQDLNNIINDMS